MRSIAADMATQPNGPAEPSFEARLEELNDLISALEGGELGLEAAIATYEKGRKLHRDLVGRLEAFERRIETLTKGADGEERAVPAPEFDPDRGAADDAGDRKGRAGGGASGTAAPPPTPAPAPPAKPKPKPKDYADDVPF
jgi:exodeoxyribonuclease VII small subunit